MTRHLLSIALLCAAIPAVAQPQSFAPAAPQEPPCLRQANIYSWQAVPGNKAIIVTDLARKRYRVSFMGTCYNLQFHMGLRLKTFGAGTLSCVSKGDQVLVNDPAGPGFCVVQNVQYQNPSPGPGGHRCGGGQQVAVRAARVSRDRPLL